MNYFVRFTIGVIVVALGGLWWVSRQFSGICEDIADVRAEMSRNAGKLEQLDRRLTRLEGRMDAKFGVEDR